MAKWAASGSEIHVVIVTTGAPPLFSAEDARNTRVETKKANEVLGVTEVHFLDLPAAKLDTIPHHEINAGLTNLVAQIRPDVVFVPFVGDLHLDHHLVFRSSLVALRPAVAGAHETIYAYETVSETNWNGPYLTPGFIPNTYVDITHFLDLKLEAMTKYRSQIREYPNERSLRVLRALAEHRGGTVGVEAAEAFVQIRQLIR
jgi:LmbE family N-acetylglucosaminyl deacetylase